MKQKSVNQLETGQITGFSESKLNKNRVILARNCKNIVFGKIKEKTLNQLQTGQEPRFSARKVKTAYQQQTSTKKNFQCDRTKKSVIQHHKSKMLLLVTSSLKERDWSKLANIKIKCKKGWKVRNLTTKRQKRCFRRDQAKIGHLAGNRLENQFMFKEDKNSVTGTSMQENGFRYDRAKKSVIKQEKCCFNKYIA